MVVSPRRSGRGRDGLRHCCLAVGRRPAESDRDGGNFRPLQSALAGDWEVAADYAVTGSRTLTLPLVE